MDWRWILAAIMIAAGFFFLPSALSQLPKPKGGGGGLGSALGTLNAFFDPSRRYEQVASRELPADRTDDEPKDLSEEEPKDD